MKFPRSTNLVVLAAVATMAHSVQAQSLEANIPSASGTFIFSANLLGGFQLINVAMSAVNPASLAYATDDSVGSVTGTPNATYTAGAAAPLHSLTLDSGNAITGITSTGGIALTDPKGPVSNGGNLVINNLSYDPTSNTITADISGANKSGSYTLATTHEQVFTVNTLDYSTDGGSTWNPILAANSSGVNAGPTHFQIPSAGNYLIRSDGLFLVGGNTGTIFSQFKSSLGLTSIAVGSLQSIDAYDPVNNPDGFGSLTVSSTFAVPEPQKGMIFGLGLAVLGGVHLVARRLRRT